MKVVSPHGNCAACGGVLTFEGPLPLLLLQGRLVLLVDVLPHRLDLSHRVPLSCKVSYTTVQHLELVLFFTAWTLKRTRERQSCHIGHPISFIIIVSSVTFEVTLNVSLSIWNSQCVTFDVSLSLSLLMHCFRYITLINHFQCVTFEASLLRCHFWGGTFEAVLFMCNFSCNF